MGASIRQLRLGCGERRILAILLLRPIILPLIEQTSLVPTDGLAPFQ
ncbi:hypothetical protein OH809_43400 [Streptomyces sp. NBC_00873]|nr:hypothetical protein OH809_00310 [Streptomyces sp. NBC_00873]WSY96871.1 hypothetical protein OH809_43400 [Streptomyces sp. NBC_00873]WTA41356.1 hypothetical protein OH821_00310 [Streptomyces sp. NBC_00842]WTA48541.1 hypothetical protein OH821_43505 [Streptomyces sp. NBC_00842]